MAMLDVSIDDGLLQWFAHKARRLGKTEEEFAQSLIEREARSEQTWQALEDNSTRVRDRMKNFAKYESNAKIPKDRDR